MSCSPALTPDPARDYEGLSRALPAAQALSPSVQEIDLGAAIRAARTISRRPATQPPQNLGDQQTKEELSHA